MRIAFGRFTFDADTREILEDGRRVHVSPKAFDLLRVLLERRPSVVSKNELHDKVWPEAFVGDANLSVVIAEIRQVLGDDSKDGRFIRTVHRVGYAFSGTVTEGGADAGAARSGYRCWLVWNERTLPLTGGEQLLGRDPRCSLHIDASGVSRRHARLVVGAGEATIADLGSSNGTFVQGHAV
ncbi:MAG: winged helix-turn-helix domain-containing protein, partial [Vicinamibacterales bacterium]